MQVEIGNMFVARSAIFEHRPPCATANTSSILVYSQDKARSRIMFNSPTQQSVCSTGWDYLRTHAASGLHAVLNVLLREVFQFCWIQTKNLMGFKTTRICESHSFTNLIFFNFKLSVVARQVFIQITTLS